MSAECKRNLWCRHDVKSKWLVETEIMDVMGLDVMMANVGVGHCGLAPRSQALIAAVL